VPDWAAVAALTVVSSAPGAAAAPVPGQPGVFTLTGLVRGAAAAFVPAGSPAPPPGGFVVGVAVGRNASEANAWGGTFVFNGEFA
jgi:hypothetical protein